MSYFDEQAMKISGLIRDPDLRQEVHKLLVSELERTSDTAMEYSRRAFQVWSQGSAALMAEQNGKLIKHIGRLEERLASRPKERKSGKAQR